MMKISVKNIFYQLLIIYPIVNLITCVLFHGDNMNMISWGYCFVLIAFYFFLTKGRAIRSYILMILWMLLTVILSFVREATNSVGSGSLLFTGTMVYMLIFSEQNKRDLINADIIEKYRKLYFTTQIIYIGILLLYVSKNGLTYGWGTRVLQGPYNYPHTLAYILLLMTMGDLFFFMKSKDKIATIIAMVSIVLIVMTAVRTVILALAFLLIYIMKDFMDVKKTRNLLIILIVTLIGLYFVNRYNLFNALSQKTALASQVHNSFSNGRWDIYITSLNSLKTYKGNKLYAIVFGMGMSALSSTNYLIFGSEIHAHNDFIDAFVCYGIINLIIYTYIILTFTKSGRLWFLLTIGLLAFGNGLYMYIDAIPMLYLSRLLFKSGKKLTEIS